VDAQLKLRGFRIEPGEIEAVLRRAPEVQEAVVVVQGQSEHRQLVAYLRAGAGAAIEVGALRQRLRRQLPDYMVPSHLVVLDALPLTPTGKVDYRALPASDQTRPELGKTFEAPRTEVEEVLASTWAEVLGLERVGVNDNFFELGGHSLLATQIISRLRDAFRMELPLRQLFEAPTVASLAEWIEAIRWTRQNPQSVLGVSASDHEQGEL
jgi:acyl carrier protein